MTWLPLLTLAPAPAAQSSQPSTTVRLCRVDVSPCQREVNLPPGEEVTLGLLIGMNEYAGIPPDHELIAWHFRLLLEGDEAITFPDVDVTGMPFRERDRPQSALAGLNLLNEGVRTSSATGSYYRVKNSYSLLDRRLEYAVTIVANAAGGVAQPGLRPGAGKEALLGTLTLRGSEAGTARLVIDLAEPGASKLVTLSPTGEFNAVDLHARGPLSLINVGESAEKLRLEGQAWSDVPDGQESYMPLTRIFRIEVWDTESLPAWRGGSGQPLATFTNIQPDDEGFFTVRDVPAELIPEGTYDLRNAGEGIISHVQRNVRFDFLDSQPGDGPKVIWVSLGRLTSGDINGDNVVDDHDLSALAASFGRQVHETETGALADFNHDGVVDGQDFSLMAANYGKRGE